MQVYRIPKHLQDRILKAEEITRDNNEKIFKIIEDLTGIKPNAIYGDAPHYRRLKFVADINKDDCPEWLRRVDGGFQTNKNTKKGKQIEQAFREAIQSLPKAEDIFNIFGPCVVGPTLRVKFEFLFGELVISDVQGYKIEEMGCEKVDVEDLINEKASKAT